MMTDRIAVAEFASMFCRPIFGENQKYENVGTTEYGGRKSLTKRRNGKASNVHGGMMLEPRSRHESLGLDRG